MNNFKFTLPTRFYFGKGEERRTGEYLKTYGTRKVMIIHYGDFVKQTGLFDRITESIDAAGIPWVETSGVQPNPRVELVRECIRKAKEEKVDFLLAIGGGSVIDTAKATGAGMHYDGDVWELYEGKGHAAGMTNLGVVLTIPAAGSESNGGSVITNGALKMKRGYGEDFLRPKFAIMNPELTFSLPPFQTAAGGYDIISHIMERYFTRTVHCDLTDELCEGAMRAVIKNLPAVLENPRDYDARAEIMWAGNIAHNGILGVGREEDWGSHELGHALSAFYDVTHGASLAIIFPAWMKYVYRLRPEIFARFAEKVWGVEPSGDDEAMALEGIERLIRFIRSIGLPASFREAGIPTDKIEEMAAHCTPDTAPVTGMFQKLDRQDCVQIYRLAE